MKAWSDYLDRPVVVVSEPIDLPPHPESESKLASIAAHLPDVMAGLPAWITPALVEATQAAWTPIYGYPVTQEEAIEIIQTFDRLTDLLEE